LLLIGLFSAIWTTAVFYYDVPANTAVPTAYALPLILVVSLYCALRLALKGGMTAPWLLTMLGVFYVVGGGAFDITATIIHSPDLQREANPIARTLLDSDHSIRFVYSYAGVCQSLYLSLICTLWIALLKHRQTLAASVSDTRSFFRFLKAATAGAHLSWRQWLFPIKLSELPNAYHLMWVMSVVMIIGVIDRWYLGLEWFRLVPSLRWIVNGVGLVAGLTLYLIWLWLASRITDNPEEPDPQDVE